MMGYKEIPSGNIKDCLYADTNYAEWYVDKYGDLRADANHHDGTNHYLYRVFKDGVSETQMENLKNKIYYGKATRADIVLQVLSFVAQNEMKNIRKRQAQGIAAAKAKGMKFGRPVIKAPPDFPEIGQKWENGIIKSYEAAEMCGMCESTFYHRLRDTEPHWITKNKNHCKKVHLFTVIFLRS